MRLLEMIQEDPRYCTSEVAEEFECNHTATAQHLRGLGKTCRCGAWIARGLSGYQQVRQDVCMNFLTLRRDFSWLKNLVTGDEKWMIYVNRQQSVGGSVAAKQEFPAQNRNFTQKG